MKKIFTLLLALIVCLSLCACGSEGTGTATTTAAIETTEGTTVPATTMPEGYSAQSISIGETISLDYAVMTLDNFEISGSYHFKYTIKEGNTKTTYNSIIPCADGTKLVCLQGILTNQSSRVIEPKETPIFGKLIINDEAFSLHMRCFVVEKAQSMQTVNPKEEAEYYFYAEVPVELLEQMETCQVYIGFTADMDPTVAVPSIDAYDALYLLDAIPSAKK